MLSSLKIILAAFAVTAVYWLYSRLWIIRRYDYPEEVAGTPTVYAHWHGDELLLVGAFSGQNMAVLSSWSRDGTLMSHVLRWLGYRVSRGSSSKGGCAGLKGLVDAVKDGSDASLAVDGPRGPYHQVKPGVLKLAQLTGSPIVPGAAAASRRYVFKKAWNKCYLPLPFSRCAIVYGKPVRIAPDASDAELEESRLRLEAELAELAATAESRVLQG